MTRVLIAEDEPLIALDWHEELIAAGYEVVGPFISEADLMKSLETGSPEVALLDLLLSDGPCHAAIRELRRRDVPVILCSGEVSTAAAGLPDVQWISKPAKMTSLIMAIEAALNDRSSTKEILGPVLAAIVLVGMICDALG